MNPNNDIESNRVVVEEEEEIQVNRMPLYCSIYVGVVVCTFIGVLIYGCIEGSKYSTHQINTFYMTFISLSIFPVLCYLLYLTCKCNKCFCVI